MNDDDDHGAEPPRLYRNHLKCPWCYHQWYDPWMGDPTYDCPKCWTADVRVSRQEEIVVATTEVQVEIDAAYEALVRALRRAEKPEVSSAFLIAIAWLAREGGSSWEQFDQGLISRWAHMQYQKLDELLG